MLLAPSIVKLRLDAVVPTDTDLTVCSALMSGESEDVRGEQRGHTSFCNVSGPHCPLASMTYFGLHAVDLCH